MNWRRERPALIILTTFVLAISACGAPGPGEGDSITPDAASPVSEASGTPVSEPGDSNSPDETPPDGETSAPTNEEHSSEYTYDDVGSGLVRVDGVEYSNFLGSCNVHRGFGENFVPIPVGDLSDPDLSVLVGIDNLESKPEMKFNFTIVGGETFRMSGFGGDGTIDNIAYLSDMSHSGSVSMALVAFSGTTKDGVPVVAEIVCEIGTGAEAEE